MGRMAGRRQKNFFFFFKREKKAQDLVEADGDTQIPKVAKSKQQMKKQREVEQMKG